ncbi:MAG TPA: serine/threonine-protein kinase [Aggregatilineales bacterium]|nr:serine/threonine-protein kinase [Aggregatilineales bacterium]
MCADLRGQVINGYEFQTSIGMGGYGLVYRALQSGINREVAIKMILPDYAAHESFRQRFDQEARLVATLEHPYVVPLYDYWQDDNGAFLVMRYLRGGSMRARLRQGNPLSLEEVNHLLGQAGDALATAHLAGVVHRDFKPDNLLLDERGNVYLSDFGIAKDLNLDLQLTKSGIVGSPAYLSPEQVLRQGVTPASDIYCLGITVFELLTGQHPFFGTSASGMFNKHIKDPVPSVMMTRPSLPPAVDYVIQKATAKNPAQRYRSVYDLRDALQAVI